MSRLNKGEMPNKENEGHGFVNKVKEVAADVVETIKPKALTVDELRAFFVTVSDSLRIAKLDGLVLEYNNRKEKEKWVSASKIKVINKGPDYICGGWKCKHGSQIELPDFEVNRLFKDFPNNWEVVE